MLKGAIVVAPARAWMGSVVPGGLSLLLLPVLGRRRMKSIRAELIAAAVFASAVVPLALSGPSGALEAGLAAAAGSLLIPGGRDLLAALPPALASLGVASATRYPRHLKHIGWRMVATYTATLVLLLLL